MQGFNRYFPPDYDPKEAHGGNLNKIAGKHALGNRARKIDQGILVVRFEMPYNMWCGHCESHIAQGVRFNAEKKKIGNYLSSPIYSFRFKCHLCTGPIEIRSNPRDTSYDVYEGGRQKHEEWDPAVTGAGTFTYSLHSRPEDAEDADPLGRLEREATARKEAASAKSHVSQLLQANARTWSDPWLMSSRLRRTFRREKKVRAAQGAAREAISESYGLHVPLLEKDPGDRRPPRPPPSAPPNPRKLGFVAFDSPLSNPNPRLRRRYFGESVPDADSRAGRGNLMVADYCSD